MLCSLFLIWGGDYKGKIIMFNTNFGDTHTAADRINWWYAKKSAYLRMSRWFAKTILVIAVGVGVGSFAVGGLQFAATKMIQHEMIAQQSKKCVVYKNCEGFQYVTNK